MKRNVTTFILAAMAACLIFTQIGCSDKSTATAGNFEGVKKPVTGKDGKNDKTEGVQDALIPK